MADAIHGNIQIGSTKEELIAAVVQKELAFQAKLLATVTDFSFLAGPGFKSIQLPLTDSFVATDRASGAAGDATVLTFDGDTMLLDHCAYVAWIVDSCDEIQSKVQVQAELAKRAAAAHARKIDTDLIAELELVGEATTTVGNISKDIVLEMRETLCTRFANMDDMTLVVGCDQEKILLGISDFVQADTYGSSNIPGGVIGRLYGVNVLVHAGLAASTYYMYERSGMGIAFQQAPRMSRQGSNEHGSGAERVVLDQLYGVKGLQIEQAGAAAGISALVVKDGN